jgi:predicted phage baseplate assembly protein
MNGSLDPSLRDLNDCGCCAGVTVETPVKVFNRPGLAAIAYRIGTHALFKESLLARLTGSDLPALRGLKMRNGDDFSIALLDAWATTADVLTFYEERIANESYLRTATERLSLLQLARLIGYELRPGVAASVDLAFTVEGAKGPGVPNSATIEAGTKVQSIPGPGEQPQIFETLEILEARAEWNTLKPKTTQLPEPRVVRGAQLAYLKGVNTGLKEGDGLLFVGSDRQTNTNSQQWDFRQVTKVSPDASAGWTLVEWSEGLGAPSVDPSSESKVYAFRKRAALFGSNSPDPVTLSDDVLLNYGQGMASRDSTTWVVTRRNEWNFSLTSPINLDAIYPSITPSVKAADGGRLRDSWIVLALPNWHYLYEVTKVSESSPKLYTLTTKTTQLTLDTDTDNFLASKFLPSLRSVEVFAQTDELEFAELPLLHPIEGSSIALDQTANGIEKGHRIIVSGKKFNASHDDRSISETVVVEQLSDDGMTITLHLQDGLKNQYDPATVTIYGNVAAATNGETKQEALGSGDASQSYQQFTLKQSPLTYVSSTKPSGADSTLQVRVNDLLWHEMPTFYGHGPHERIFVTRTGDDGTTTVEFGDGQTGARLPTGRENVTVRYRKGIGTVGNLKAEQLSLLMTRPLGVKGVINPDAAAGAADRESFAEARRNAPLTVLTLDRIVSLQDYEDFARAFSGVAKALATWTWTGEVRGVFVTVAGSDGALIPEGSATHDNLVTAMKGSGDPYIPRRVQSYRPVFFKLGAVVKLDPDYEPEKVLTVVEKALRSAFSFDARAFGQAVTASEVMAVTQGVAGVIAVDITKLYRAGDAAVANDLLLSAVPQAGAGALPGSQDDIVSAAELLTLSAGPLDELGIMT